MTKPRISQVLLWTLALVTLALFGFFVALIAGVIPVGDPSPPPDSGALPASQTEPADEPATTAVTKRVRRTTPAPRRHGDYDRDHGAGQEHDAAGACDRGRHSVARGLLDLGARLETGRVLDSGSSLRASR